MPGLRVTVTVDESAANDELLDYPTAVTPTCVAGVLTLLDADQGFVVAFGPGSWDRVEPIPPKAEEPAPVTSPPGPGTTTASTDSGQDAVPDVAGGDLSSPGDGPGSGLDPTQPASSPTSPPPSDPPLVDGSPSSSPGPTESSTSSDTTSTGDSEPSNNTPASDQEQAESPFPEGTQVQLA